jgi:hypothetical protein
VQEDEETRRVVGRPTGQMRKERRAMECKEREVNRGKWRGWAAEPGWGETTEGGSCVKESSGEKHDEVARRMRREREGLRPVRTGRWRRIRQSKGWAGTRNKLVGKEKGK